MTPRTKLERLTGHGDDWIIESTLDYAPGAAGPFHLVKLLEFKDGKVIRNTRYFAEPFRGAGGTSEVDEGTSAAR